jgi:hypothetical protein
MCLSWWWWWWWWWWCNVYRCKTTTPHTSISAHTLIIVIGRIVIIIVIRIADAACCITPIPDGTFAASKHDSSHIVWFARTVHHWRIHISHHANTIING